MPYAGERVFFSITLRPHAPSLGNLYLFGYGASLMG
jgi:hypothetical protein